MRKDRIIKTIPYVDEETGEAVPDNPALNKEGFWTKPETSTADFLKKVNKKIGRV